MNCILEIFGWIGIFKRFAFRPTESIVDTSVYRTNLVYGELSPELSHVISIHGTVDPWHALGLREDLAENVITIVVNGIFSLHSVSATKITSPPLCRYITLQGSKLRQRERSRGIKTGENQSEGTDR